MSRVLFLMIKMIFFLLLSLFFHAFILSLFIWHHRVSVVCYEMRLSPKNHLMIFDSISAALMLRSRCYKNRHFVCQVPGEEEKKKKKRQTMCLMPIMVASGTEVGIRPSLSSCWMPLIRWLASALQWAHWKVFDNQWMKAAVLVCCNRTQII